MKHIVVTIGIMLGLAFGAVPAHAQNDLSIFPSQDIVNDEGLECDIYTGEVRVGCIPHFLRHLAALFVRFAGFVFIVMMIIGGYRYMFGALPGQGKEAGRAYLMWAIIGLVVMALSLYIIDFIFQAIGR